MQKYIWQHVLKILCTVHKEYAIANDYIQYNKLQFNLIILGWVFLKVNSFVTKQQMHLQFLILLFIVIKYQNM